MPCQDKSTVNSRDEPILKLVVHTNLSRSTKQARVIPGSDVSADIVISEHSSIGCANLTAHRCASLEADAALHRLAVTFHHFGGYSAYCQTGEAHRTHFEVDVIRGTQREPLPAAGPSTNDQSNVFNLQSNVSVQINQNAAAGQLNSSMPTMVSPGSTLQQNGTPANAQVVANGVPVPLNGQTSHTLAPTLPPVTRQPTPPTPVLPSISGIMVHSVDHTDFKLGEADSRGCTRILGVFSRQSVANKAATQHAQRERRFAASGNADCGPLLETRNSVHGALLQCRTFEDFRDRFIVDVRTHIVDVLDDGDGFRGYGDDGESGEDDADEDAIPNAKRRRI